MKRIKVGDMVRLSKKRVKYGGCIGTVIYTNTAANIYFVGGIAGNTYASDMDVPREHMTVLSKEEYPELYI